MVDIMNLGRFDLFHIKDVDALWNIIVQLLTMFFFFQIFDVVFSHIELEPLIYASVE